MTLEKAGEVCVYAPGESVCVLDMLSPLPSQQPESDNIVTLIL